MKTTKNNKQDILIRKQKQLGKYQAQYNVAVSVVTSTIENLKSIVQGIDETIRDIDAYQSELNTTRVALSEARERNSRVILNFSKLLGEE